MVRSFEVLNKLFTNRLVLLFGITGIILSVHHAFTGFWIPSADAQNSWFYSGIFMVLFSILFIEPFFTSPKNIFMNVLPLILMLLPLKESFVNQSHWWLFIGVLLFLLVSSITSFLLYDGDKSPEDDRNRFAVTLKDLLLRVGKAKILYTIVFFYFLIAFYGSNTSYLITMLTIWLAIVLFIDPQKTHNNFFSTVKKRSPKEIGSIIGVDSGNIFTVRLYRDKNHLNKFDPVRFRHSIHNQSNEENYGVVIDLFELNAEKRARVLLLQTVPSDQPQIRLDSVHAVEENDPTLPSLRIADLAGTIAEGTTASTITFDSMTRSDDLQAGDLLEVAIGRRIIYYQLIDGTTESIKVADMDVHGRVRGTAIQLGEWDSASSAFTRFGWVPRLNQAVYISRGKEAKVKKSTYPQFTMGHVPNSKLPVNINLHDAVSHHTAIIGVTGSGKSFLTRAIIDQLTTNTKIIFVDYNNEFKRSINPEPLDLISPSAVETLTAINLQLFENDTRTKAKQDDLTQTEVEFERLVIEQLTNFFNDEKSMVRIFQPPDMDNEEEAASYQTRFYQALFKVARSLYQQQKSIRICMVIEEAHAIIPEPGKKELIAPVKKIALQGRKYGLGLLVITQRTANVSKDILSQCNTIICLQSFDNTTKEFLAGYAGDEVKGMIAGLKRYQAVVVGKALNSPTPLIVDTYGVGK